MTRTRASSVVFLAVLGAAVGWFLQVALVAFGHPALILPITLAIVLALIGVIIIVLALPIRRVVKGTSKVRVDPFYATRVVLLAKASTLVGALFAGAAAAMAGFLLSRSVVPGVGSVTMSIAAVVGAVVLVIAGLVAELWCTLPPDESAKQGSTPGAARP